MHKLVLSGKAYEDLIDIQNHNFSEFGETQWNKYNDQKSVNK